MAATEKQKENLKPVKPGEVRNPKGRPKGSQNLKTILEKWLSAKEKIKHPINGKEVNLSQLDIITLAQLKEARAGNVQSFNALMDRFEGKPKQISEVTGADGKDLIPAGIVQVIIENPHNARDSDEDDQG